MRMIRKDRVALFVALVMLSVPGKAHSEESLTWPDCLKEAKQNNPDLIQAQEAILQQQAGKEIEASGLYPQITSSVDASTASTTTTSSATNTTTTSRADSYSYGVTGTQLVFNGLKTVNNVKAASENVLASRQAFRFASTQVRFSLRSAFINLLKSQELIVVAGDIVRIRRDSLELITLRYQSGLEHKGALLTAEANLAQADFELSQAKRDLTFSQRELTRAMGRKQFVPMSVKGDFEVKDNAREKPSLEEIVKNNPSVLESAARTNAASFSIRSAYANFFPDLSASAGANKKSSKWPPDNENWNLGLSLNLPLFEGGLKAAQVSQAKAIYNQAHANERSVKDAALVALEQAWAELQDGLETVTVQKKSLEAAEERSKIAEAQYSTGFISFDNWIIIENDLVNAKKSYLEAKAGALRGEANLIQAKGETLEYAQ
jgi:TolC family type I secretion outer membrane protein